MSYQLEDIAPGLAGSATLVVTSEMTVPAFASWFETWRNMPEVLATIVVGGLIETACINALHPRLAQGYTSVGAHLSLDHLRPSRPGDRVEAKVILTDVKDKSFSFGAEVRVDERVVARGFHRRVAVERKRFQGDGA